MKAHLGKQVIGTSNVDGLRTGVLVANTTSEAEPGSPGSGRVYRRLSVRASGRRSVTTGEEGR